PRKGVGPCRVTRWSSRYACCRTSPPSTRPWPGSGRRWSVPARPWARSKRGRKGNMPALRSLLPSRRGFSWRRLLPRRRHRHLLFALLDWQIALYRRAGLDLHVRHPFGFIAAADEGTGTEHEAGEKGTTGTSHGKLRRKVRGPARKRAPRWQRTGFGTITD